MTSELKPCPFCNYALSMSEGICPAQDCTDEDTGKWTFTGICCPSCAAFLPKKDESSSVPHGVAAWNTRAVPDVPELVRYDISMFGNGAVEIGGGEYVRHDQAAEIIAAKDAEIKRLGSLNHYAHLEAVAIRRAEAAEAKNIELEAAWLNAEGKISDLEAKLAQYEAQEPVGYVTDRVKTRDGGHCFMSLHQAAPYINPVYASPLAPDGGGT